MRKMITRSRSAGVLRTGLAAVALTGALATTASLAPVATAAASHTVAISANSSGLLKYSSNKISVAAGKVTISFTNKSPVPHDVVLINSKNKTLGKTPVFKGGTKSFSVTLTKGKYTYYCSVPGHRAAGMQGTLTVS